MLFNKILIYFNIIINNTGSYSIASSKLVSFEINKYIIFFTLGALYLPLFSISTACKAAEDSVDIESLLIERKSQSNANGILGSIFQTSTDPRERIENAFGVTVEASYTIYSNWDPDLDEFVANGLFGFASGWEVINRGSNNSGSFFAYIENRHDLSTTTGLQFERQQGSIWPINAISSQPFTRLRQLFYRQELFNNQLILGVGKLSTRALWSRSRFTSNKATTFQSAPLALARSTPWPSDSVGFYARWQKYESLFNLSAGVFDAEPEPYGLDFDVEGPYFFFGLSLFSSPWTPASGTEFPNHLLQITTYHRPETRSSKDVWGFVATYDWQLTPRVGVGSRYGLRTKDFGGISQLAAIGLIVDRPFGREGDAFGAGVSWAEQGMDELTQLGGEIFYRSRVLPGIQITPNIQFFERSAQAHHRQSIGCVLGIRTHVVF
ncbi:carbohydrate porin [Roseibium sp. HPY-6]|uniref:carbohydrate porin n=1 Tax=Roseibium sp. HPY-6 TaxID=3229852 RepID=UPI00338F4BC5